jgi:hypothetical protein
MADLSSPLSRRALLENAAAVAAAMAFPKAAAWVRSNPDRERLAGWTATLRAEGLTRPGAPIARAATRVGELAAGTPYQPGMLDAYLRGGSRPPDPEPLSLSLTRFDCVTLVESCLAVARVAAREGRPTWARFGHEIERMRYRDGARRGYPSRLHYFSEWITDGQRRGLVRAAWRTRARSDS